MIIQGCLTSTTLCHLCCNDLFDKDNLVSFLAAEAATWTNPDLAAPGTYCCHATRENVDFASGGAKPAGHASWAASNAAPISRFLASAKNM